MEFLKNHSEIVQNEQNKIENFIKDSLIQELKKYENFSVAIKKLKNNLYFEFYKKNLINKYSFHFGGIYNTFINNVNNKSDDCPDKVFIVLEKNIYESFKSIKLKKYNNHEYDTDFENINYEKFVNELLKLDVYNNLIVNLDRILNKIEAYYDLKKIEKLSIYKLLNIKVRSDEKTKKEITKIDADLKNNLLNEKEQAFLFFVFCKILSEGKNNNAEFKIPYTEIVRLQMLIKVYDKNVFLKRHGDTLLYQYLTKEFNVFEFDEINTFIDNLNLKLSKLGLKKTKVKINEYYNFYYNSI